MTCKTSISQVSIYVRLQTTQETALPELEYYRLEFRKLMPASLAHLVADLCHNFSVVFVSFVADAGQNA